RLKGMAKLALVTAMGALARTESRGAHFRRDYPLRDDDRWLNRTLVRWPRDAAEPDFSYEPVGLIDLSPGHRGYGSTERIEMTVPVKEYNDQVAAGQVAQGAQTSGEPLGSRMKWGQY
ncbi:MAG: hypothetical protein ABF290_16535, partial [Thiogranum sp.]